MRGRSYVILGQCWLYLNRKKTIFVITTDGQENASREYDYPMVKKLIENQKQKYKWEFLFLGANIDAIAEAGRLGISRERAVRFVCDGDGINYNYMGLNKAIASYRCEKTFNDNWSKEISEYESKKGK